MSTEDRADATRALRARILAEQQLHAALREFFDAVAQEQGLMINRVDIAWATNRIAGVSVSHVTAVSIATTQLAGAPVPSGARA